MPVNFFQTLFVSTFALLRLTLAQFLALRFALYNCTYYELQCGSMWQQCGFCGADQCAEESFTLQYFYTCTQLVDGRRVAAYVISSAESTRVATADASALRAAHASLGNTCESDRT